MGTNIFQKLFKKRKKPGGHGGKEDVSIWLEVLSDNDGVIMPFHQVNLPLETFTVNTTRFINDNIKVKYQFSTNTNTQYHAKLTKNGVSYTHQLQTNCVNCVMIDPILIPNLSTPQILNLVITPDPNDPLNIGKIADIDIDIEWGIAPASVDSTS